MKTGRIVTSECVLKEIINSFKTRSDVTIRPVFITKPKRNTQTAHRNVGRGFEPPPFSLQYPSETPPKQIVTSAFGPSMKTLNHQDARGPHTTCRTLKGRIPTLCFAGLLSRSTCVSPRDRNRKKGTTCVFSHTKMSPETSKVE